MRTSHSGSLRFDEFIRAPRIRRTRRVCRTWARSAVAIAVQLSLIEQVVR